MRLALVDVIRVRVMDRVAPLPRKVRDEADGVQDVADRILEHAVVREGAVAAFVREDPEAHCRRAGDARESNPQRQGDELHRNEQAEDAHAAVQSSDCMT